jgi:mRNA interferase HigB
MCNNCIFRGLKMRVISRRRVREFWEIHPEAETSLDSWYRQLSRINPENLSELRKFFPHADLVGRCTVFNVGGNKYRVITRIYFPTQIAYIRFVLTHGEYDNDKWKTDC